MNKWSSTNYEGGTKNEWSEGKGKFSFPNGVQYVGDFHNGEFHGDGALVYPNGGKYVAKWNRGYAVEGHYVFNDELLYEDKNWQYISAKDRRFFTEVKQGLQPAGKTLLTNEETQQIPEGTYDTGNGYYDPKSEEIKSYDGKETVGWPREFRMEDGTMFSEKEWIKDHCRYQHPQK